MRRIKEIVVLPDFQLKLVFDTQEIKVMDFKSIINEGVFKELKDSTYFASVANRGYFIEWPHEQDLSADTLYLESETLN